MVNVLETLIRQRAGLETNVTTSHTTGGDTVSIEFTPGTGTTTSNPNTGSNSGGLGDARSRLSPPTTEPTPDPDPGPVTPPPSSVGDTSAPVFGAAPHTSVREDAAISTAIGQVTATDANAVTYSITGGNTGDAFAIDPSTGQITVANTLDFEGLASYVLDITATDSVGNAAVQSVTIDITDVTETDNQPPVITTTELPSIAENAALGDVVGTVLATDNVGVVEWNIVGGDSGRKFAIDSNGTISVHGALDHETKGTYTLTVQAKDAAGFADLQDVTITVTDVDESDLIKPVFAAAPTLPVVEERPAGTVVGTVTATDNVAVTGYEIVGGTGMSLFAIDDSGRITTTAVLDYDAGTTSYDLVIQAADAAGNTEQVTATIDVRNDASDDNVPPPAPDVFLLTGADDDPALTLNNDIIIGDSTTLSDDDRIHDPSDADYDQLILELNTSGVTMDVEDVEYIEINWTGMQSPSFNLDDVSGEALVNFAPTATANFTNVTFTDVGTNSIMVGDTFRSDLTVKGIEDAMIDAGDAETLTVTDGDGAVFIIADAAESITIGDETNNIDELDLLVGAEADVTLGSSIDQAWVTFEADANLTLENSDDEDDAGDFAYNLYAVNDVTLTLLDSTSTSEWSTLYVGTPDLITLSALNEDLDGKAVFNGGEIRVTDAVDAPFDASKLQHSSIVFEAAVTNIVTGVHGANYVMEASNGSGTSTSTFVMDGDADEDSAAQSMTLTLEADQNKISFGGSTDPVYEYATIIADGAGDALTITDLTAPSATQLSLLSASNDVTVEMLSAETLDASGVMGDLIVGESLSTPSAANVAIVGAQGDNTIGAASTAIGTAAGDASFIGHGGDDDVFFATTTGTAAAQLGDGNNTVDATALTTGQLAVTGGIGDDIVTVGDETNGITDGSDVILELADGDNEAYVSFKDDSTASLSVTAGTGNDVVHLLGEGATLSSDISIDLGDGYDTVLLPNANLLGSDLDLAGVEVVEVDTTDRAKFKANADIFEGQSYLLKSYAGNGDFVNIRLAETGTYDFSQLQFDDADGSAVRGLFIGPTSGNDTIYLSEGNDVIHANGESPPSQPSLDGADTYYMNDGHDKLYLGQAGSADGQDLVIFRNEHDAEPIAANEDTMLDVLLSFNAQEDKIDLTAFNLTPGGEVSGVNQVSKVGGVWEEPGVEIKATSIDISDGEIASASFHATDTDSTNPDNRTLIVFDADTGPGVNVVGFVIDDVVSVSGAIDWFF